MSYSNIVKHYEKCFETYGDNYKGVDWPNKEDAMKRYKVMLDIIPFDAYFSERDAAPSVLDFGCGLGHMYEYMKMNKINASYTGLDMSSVFIGKCREKFPELDFITMDLLQCKDDCLSLRYDYVILNGVFTEKRELSYEEMLKYFKRLIKKVYKICNYGLAFNVMSKDVEWEREDLFHLPLDVLSDFLCKEVTRDFIIRYDYQLYEYTVYVYKRGGINE